MLCMKCAYYQATNHVTAISHGFVGEVHLCDTCRKLDERKGQIACPRCGSTFESIQKRGRFGCPDDYEIFGDKIGPCLIGYHGSSQHVGKFPRKNIFTA